MKALVTGGGGFLGREITERLLARGDEVRVLARGRYPEVEALGAEGVQHDLSDPVGLTEKLAGVDVVFHVAALAGMWGPRERYVKINVDGTRHLLEAARAAGVKRFVFTSSPSVTFHGVDELNLSEAQASYPESFLFYYSETKAIAERLVLAANGPELATTALRPHLIYGGRDPHLLPRLIGRHQAGRLRIIGDGQNLISLTHVSNAAQAHLLAADALSPGSANAGKAYFITDAEPVKVWEWLNGVYQALGLPPLTRRIGVGPARIVSGLLEAIWRTLGLTSDPPITRFTVAQISTSHTYDLSASREDFGYVPETGPEEAMRETLEGLRVRLQAGGL
ncbi:MAG: NAD-dependent epimerase/dehydratase family protein [Alphaproteobacteria bacterium]|nr:NAD-dependent epimerase/dehydratase family protein [Alphaproteobacteria bacterium]